MDYVQKKSFLFDSDVNNLSFFYSTLSLLAVRERESKGLAFKRRANYQRITVIRVYVCEQLQPHQRSAADRQTVMSLAFFRVCTQTPSQIVNRVASCRHSIIGVAKNVSVYLERQWRCHRLSNKRGIRRNFTFS